MSNVTSLDLTYRKAPASIWKEDFPVFSTDRNLKVEHAVINIVVLHHFMVSLKIELLITIARKNPMATIPMQALRHLQTITQ